jgi:DNA-binding beta-propeller fold protein YncE
MRRLTQGTERCGRGALRVTALLTLLSALLVVPATAGAAPVGGLKQLAGGTGCLSGEASPPAGCTAVRGLGTIIGEAAMTNDGKQVYVTSRDKDAIVLFDRNATTGKLTQKSSILGCFTTDTTTQSNDGCSLVSSTTSILDQADAIAISPDGQSVYTTTQQGVFAFFSRASDGSLSFQQSIALGFGGVADKTFPAITVSPDGKNVYLAGPGSFGGMLWIVTRVTAAGATHGQISRTCSCRRTWW